MLLKTPSKSKNTKPNRRVKKEKKSKNETQTKTDGSPRTNSHETSSSKKLFWLFSIQPWKIILSILVLGLVGIFYLKHVFATQELLYRVEQLEQEYQQTQRRYDYYKLTYDRMIGPKEMYDKAKAAGFIDSGPAEKVIEVAPIE